MTKIKKVSNEHKSRIAKTNTQQYKILKKENNREEAGEACNWKRRVQQRRHNCKKKSKL